MLAASCLAMRLRVLGRVVAGSYDAALSGRAGTAADAVRAAATRPMLRIWRLSRERKFVYNGGRSRRHCLPISAGEKPSRRRLATG